MSVGHQLYTLSHVTPSFHRGGFFTMKYDVVDVSTQVHELYSLVDPVALETIIVEVRRILLSSFSNLAFRMVLNLRLWLFCKSYLTLIKPGKCS